MSSAEKLVFLYYNVKSLHFTTKSFNNKFLRKFQMYSSIPKVHSMMVIFHFSQLFNTGPISLSIFSILEINKYLLYRKTQSSWNETVRILHYLSVRGWEGILLLNDGRSRESGFLSILQHAWIFKYLNMCTLPFKHICQ